MLVEIERKERRRMNALFVGNGINRKEGISEDWNQLLNSIDSKSTEDISKTFGMTLRYEYIDVTSTETGTKLKKSIAQSINKSSQKIRNIENSVHRSLMELPLDCILTTNYDYALEYAAEPKFKSKYTTKEQVYSFCRYQEAGGKRVYHIHGECAYPKSICLGFEHYAGILEKMRGTLVKSTHSDERKKHRFQLYDVLTGITEQPDEWYYKMFVDDISFLGFGFGAAEEDIWWLLCYRKRLIKEYGNLIHNHLRLLDVTPDDKLTELDKVALRKMLNVLDVEIVDFTGSIREKKYEAALRYLREQM